jgi:hypothetical protein
MSKNTAKQRAECMQSWLASVKRPQPIKRRIVHESKISLDEILRTQNK